MELELVPPYPDEPLLLGGIERFGGCSQLRCRVEDGSDLATVFGSGNKQQRLGVLGQRCTRAKKARSMRSPTGSGAGIGSAPASSASLNTSGSSSKARGLPPVAATRR